MSERTEPTAQEREAYLELVKEVRELRRYKEAFSRLTSDPSWIMLREIAERNIRAREIDCIYNLTSVEDPTGRERDRISGMVEGMHFILKLPEHLLTYSTEALAENLEDDNDDAE